MKEIKEEITVTSKRVTKVVSADGAFSRFVSQDYAEFYIEKEVEKVK